MKLAGMPLLAAPGVVALPEAAELGALFEGKRAAVAVRARHVGRLLPQDRGEGDVLARRVEEERPPVVEERRGLDIGAAEVHVGVRGQGLPLLRVDLAQIAVPRPRALDVGRVLNGRRLGTPELADRHGEDPQVEPERPVVDVPDVLLDPLRPGDLVAPIHLRPARDPGRHLQAPPLVLGVVGGLLDQVGARPDERHLPHEHVGELRELVEARAAQPAPAAGDARVVREDPVGVGEAHALSLFDRVLDHRPELEEPERPPAAADSLLDEEDGTAGLQQDPDRDAREERREDDEEERGAEAVEEPLDRFHATISR